MGSNLKARAVWATAMRAGAPLLRSETYKWQWTSNRRCETCQACSKREEQTGSQTLEDAIISMWGPRIRKRKEGQKFHSLSCQRETQMRTCKTSSKRSNTRPFQHLWTEMAKSSSLSTTSIWPISRALTHSQISRAHLRPPQTTRSSRKESKSRTKDCRRKSLRRRNRWSNRSSRAFKRAGKTIRVVQTVSSPSRSNKPTAVSQEVAHSHRF